MFFLKIEGLSLERIAKVAGISGVPMETVAELAVVKGLAELEKMDGQEEIEVAKSQMESNLNQDDRFILTNWKQMTDHEMASALGSTSELIRKKRCALGLLRSCGAKRITSEQPFIQKLSDEQRGIVRQQMAVKTDRELAIQFGSSISAVKFVRRQIATEFILANWQTMDDRQMAKAVGLGLSSSVRLRLGERLLRPRNEIDTSEFSEEDLRYALLEGGETLRGFLQKRKLKMTRQNLSLRCAMWGIDLKQRTPNWYANHYECPTLANKEDLLGLLQHYRSIDGTLNQLKTVSAEILKRVCSLHCIDFREFEGGRRERALVELTCSNPSCGKTFFRAKRSHTRALRVNHDKQNYCSRRCYGKILGHTFGWGARQKGKGRKQEAPK
ncbi:MAG: hypothetical protein AAB589_03210 [Patescibacteria group bacterium]